MCGENVAAADRLYEVADFEEHDVAITKPPRGVFAVVSIFFADVEYMMCGGEFVHNANGIFVAGVGELASVEYADDGDVVTFDRAIDGESVIWAQFFFVVMDVGVAGIPVLFLRVIPAFEGDFNIFGAFFRYVDYYTCGFVFGAAFYKDIGATAGSFDFKFTVAEKERSARAVFEHGVWGFYKFA